MLRKLFHWIQGYLCIRIGGNGPERFINLCTYRKIYIWNLSNIENEYEFYISIKNFKMLKPIIRKTKIRPRIMKRFGLPFFIHRHRNKKMFFIGIAICGILVYIMSLFIWDIQLQGGSKYTPEAIAKFLDANDVYVGVAKEKVDCPEIEKKIRLNYNDIGWVSAEMRGTRLIIKITETNMPAPAGVAREPSHIVATKDGIIESIITRAGRPMVKSGDVVKKGDVLVSGIIDLKSDFDEIIEYQTLVASASIKSKSYYDYQDVFSLEYDMKAYTNSEKKGYYVSILNNKLFLYNPSNKYDNYDIIVNEEVVKITESFCLPFRYGTIASKEYELHQHTYTKDEAVTMAKNKVKRYFDKLNENGVEILENGITIRIEDNQCITEGRIIVREPAWEYKTIQENEWRIEQLDELN